MTAVTLANALPLWPQPDLLLVNFYQGEYAYYDPKQKKDRSTTQSAAGQRLPRGESSWLYVFPAAFRDMLRWVAARYGSVPIVITENGVSAPGESGS